MISKACDRSMVEWDKQLPLLLFVYHSTIQESTRESPFFLLYGLDPCLPTASDLDLPRSAYAVDIEDYKTEFVVSLRKVHECAREQIEVAQDCQKKFDDRKCQEATYKVGERVMVYMPIDALGKDRKLPCPYHVLTMEPTGFYL